MTKPSDHPVTPSPRHPIIPSPRHTTRPSLRVTYEGWLWMLTAGALWGTGLYKGINLITLVAYVMLLTWLLNIVLAGRQVKGLRLRRRTEECAFAQVPFTVEVELHNPGERARTAVRLVESGSAHALSWFRCVLEGEARARWVDRLELPRRGWYDWPPPRVCSGYPFGLVERAVSAPAEKPLLVYPALGRLHLERLRRFLRSAAAASCDARQQPRRHPAAQAEVHGLRNFRTGDSPRWIHWRTSARRGSLMIREFEESPSNHLVLVLEPWLPDAPPQESRQLLETAVSLAAAIAWEWCQQPGVRFVLAVSAPDAPVLLDGATDHALAQLSLECLALAEGSPHVAAEPLLERLEQLNLPPAPILVISTHDGTLGDLIARRCCRATACINVADLSHHDFYEAPPSGA